MAVANQSRRRSYPARWQRLLDSCLFRRTQIDEFEHLSELALKEFPVESKVLVEVLLSSRASADVHWDPLIPKYLDSLYRQRRVTLQDILKCLLRKSTVSRLRDETGTGEAVTTSITKKKRKRSIHDTFVSDFRIIQNGLMAVTAGYPPLTKIDAAKTLLAIADWMNAISALNPDSQKDDSERQSNRIMTSPDGVSLIEALGILTAGLLATQTTIDAVVSNKADDLRKKMGKALDSYLLLCDQFSAPLRMRLESLQKEFKLLDTDAKTTDEGDLTAINPSFLNFEASIIDTPPVNSKAGLYIYLNAMLVGRPLIDNGLLMAYLHNRYQGNYVAVVEELITASFDVLANAKMRSESLFLKKSFLVNKVPSMLQEMAAVSPQPVPMELCISRALSRVDAGEFPSLSALFVNRFHKSSPLADIRQEFVFSCALHKLIPESSIEPLLGETPMQSLPPGGQLDRSEVASQIIQFPDRLEQHLRKTESMDGNPSVVTVALIDAIKHFCENGETAVLKNICSCIAKRPRILDVIMLFNQPSDFMPSLSKLINEWKWEKPEKQKAYDEFSSILLFIFAVRCRYALTLEDLGLEVGESLLQRLITQGHTSGPLQDVDEKTKENVGAWIKALFVSEHISEEALPCGPQEFYSMISIVTSQSMAACERNRLAFETLKAGFDNLLEPYLMPSLLFALRWLEGHVLNYQGDLTPSLKILEALVKPPSIAGDAQETHQLILQLLSRSFEDTLQMISMKHPAHADAIGRIMEVFTALGSYEQTPTVHHNALRKWFTSTRSGGIINDLLNHFESLVFWCEDPLCTTPFSYTHCLLLTALQIVGAVEVLRCLILGLQRQASSGSLEIALDVAASFVVAPTVETFTRDRVLYQHQGPLNDMRENKNVPPQRSGSTRMSLRDALICEREQISSEDLKRDEFRAQLVIRLFRRVNSLTMPPQPIPQGVHMSSLGVGVGVGVPDMIPEVPINSTQAAGDPGIQGIQGILEAVPVPSGGNTLPASGNDMGGMNSFEMLIDDPDFMLDGFFPS